MKSKINRFFIKFVPVFQGVPQETRNQSKHAPESNTLLILFKFGSANYFFMKKTVCINFTIQEFFSIFDLLINKIRLIEQIVFVKKPLYMLLSLLV